MKLELSIGSAFINSLTIGLCIKSLFYTYSTFTLLILLIAISLLCHNIYSIIKYYEKNNK